MNLKHYKTNMLKNARNLFEHSFNAENVYNNFGKYLEEIAVRFKTKD